MNIFIFFPRKDDRLLLKRETFSNMSEMSRKISENVFDVSSTDDSTLWSEWNDAMLNKENWAFPKSN